MGTYVKAVHNKPDDILTNLKTRLDKGEIDECYSLISHLGEESQVKMLLGEDVSKPDS